MLVNGAERQECDLKMADGVSITLKFEKQKKY